MKASEVQKMIAALKYYKNIRFKSEELYSGCETWPSGHNS